MTDIAKLQEAVETSRAAYARASEQHENSRKEVLSLAHMVEEQLRVKRIELSQIEVQHERMTEECGQIEQMLNTLSVTVEVGAAGTPGDDPTAIEARPDEVTPLAPVAVASKPNVPAAEATQAGVEIFGAGPAEIRAGLKHMLKNMRASADQPETVQTNGSRAPTPAE
jgi:hypothetical protein